MTNVFENNYKKNIFLTVGDPSELEAVHKLALLSTSVSPIDEALRHQLPPCKLLLGALSKSR